MYSQREENLDVIIGAKRLFLFHFEDFCLDFVLISLLAAAKK